MAIGGKLEYIWRNFNKFGQIGNKFGQILNVFYLEGSQEGSQISPRMNPVIVPYTLF